MSIKKDIMWRVAVVYICLLLFGILIIGKVIFVQFVQGQKYRDKAERLSERDVKVLPDRGDIYACDLRLLASSVPYYVIRMDMRASGLTNGLFNRKVDSLALCLSRFYGDKSKEQYKRDLIQARKKGNRYYLVNRTHITYEELKKVRTFPLLRLKANDGGLVVEQIDQRIYPYMQLAKRTIGYISDDEGGVVGIEGAFNNELKGIEGLRFMQKLSGGVWMPVNDGNEVEPQDGYDVITTIDINIQDVAHKALLEQLINQNADHGCAILMEVKTGDIKAIVNLQKDKEGNYRELYNHAIGESTEPGSTFKLPALMIALEDGYVDLDDTVDIGKGITKYYDKTVKDDEGGRTGKLTVKEIFEISSNVGVSKIITKYYTGNEKNFVNSLYSMNLNQMLDLEIKGEGKPIIKSTDDKLWSGISLAMMSHGYEVQMTPLQILTFYNAVANNGKMVKPRFVKELRQHGKTKEVYNVQILNPGICSASTIRQAKEMLEGVVEEGTARNLKVKHLKIAGKTGTAQIAQSKGGYVGESGTFYQASFVGYFPADNPKYSCIVVVNSPSKSVYHGNQVAGPVFLEIANKVFATSVNMLNEISSHEEYATFEWPYSKAGNYDALMEVFDELDVKVKDNGVRTNWVNTTKTEERIVLNDRKIIPKLVPNVVDMGLKDAIFLLESSGLRVVANGRGKVARQSISPGSRISKGQTIFLQMSFSG